MVHMQIKSMDWKQGYRVIGCLGNSCPLIGNKIYGVKAFLVNSCSSVLKRRSDDLHVQDGEREG